MKIIETERLILRELTEEDFPALCEMLCDKEVMYAWEHGFSHQEARDWLCNQQKRYETDGFGYFAVILKSTGELIGQCGLLKQDELGDEPEIGYIFNKRFWHNGYALESAKACKKYAFGVLNAESVCSAIRENNFPSRRVAEKNGMTVQGKIVKHYYGMDMPHLIYRTERGDGNDGV